MEYAGFEPGTAASASVCLFVDVWSQPMKMYTRDESYCCENIDGCMTRLQTNISFYDVTYVDVMDVTYITVCNY